MTLLPELPKIDPKVVWDKASPELILLGQETLRKAAVMANEFLLTGKYPEAPKTPPGSLEEALTRADALDAKLQAVLMKRAADKAEAFALVEHALEAAFKIVLASVV